jgi:hypothetical protein
MIQFIRKTGPENHTHEAKWRTTHTRSTWQADTLAKHRPRRHAIETKGIETVSQLKQKLKADPKLEDGAHRRTTRLEKSASELQDQTRPEESVNQRGADGSVHCAYDAHVPSSGQPRIRTPTWDSTSNPNSASMEGTT